MRESSRRIHYKVLGYKLQLLREKLHESVDEVSGAVEIDSAQLQRIESGELQPAEDVLLLLLTHLDADDDEVVNLWELAGYTQAGLPDDLLPDEPTSPRSVYMVLTPESRTLYTDTSEVGGSINGVTINFAQGSQNVAQLGMSREHARDLMLALHRALTESTSVNRQLPPPRKSN